ncbi:GAF sensor signal transduction histidine kinase [Scytonema sp. HK-05]|uniref:ATP-binding protein n=1 Tax=Scytonema sp. HK-05 TaxID=1137095 RepID=UPI000AFCFFC2|nr:ATP-binding protein [Scytonema sp. HK-05]BAY48494.1 GAF sensor signal transduction histidine kinase [Scytonema sp. HK-05]
MARSACIIAIASSEPKVSQVHQDNQLGTLLPERTAEGILETLSFLSYRSGEIKSYLHEITCGVSRLLRLDWSTVTLCQDGFERVMASSLEFEGMDQLYSLHGTLTNTVVQTGRTLAVADASIATEYGEPPDGYLSYLGVPLRTFQGQVIGTICSFNVQPCQFTTDEIRIAEIFAERAATALFHYQLYQQQQQFNQTLEAEVAKRTEALRAAQAKLVESECLAATGEFAAMIVHELRNPLTTVKIGLNYFKRAELPEVGRMQLLQALGATSHLEYLLEQILVYAKPLMLQLAELEVNSFITGILPSLQELPAAIERQIEFKIAPVAHLFLGDKVKLHQALLHMVENACEASPPSSVVLLSVAESTTSQISIQVHNSGEPISPELLPKLTEPFYSTKPNRYGLGLAIVKRIMVAHSGQLVINSDPTTGTVMSISLPVLEPPERSTSAIFSDSDGTQATEFLMKLPTTSQLHSQQHHQRSIDILSALIGRSHLPLDSYLQDIAASVSELVSSDWTIVTLREGDSGRIAASSLEVSESERVYSLHGTLSDVVAQQRRTLVIADTRQQGHGTPPEGYLCYLGVPVQTPQGEIIGTICSFNKEPRQFTNEELRIVELFAERAAIAIDNHRLYHQQWQFQEILEAEVIKRTQELRAAQARLIEKERLAAVGEFATRMVNEIRQPVTTITDCLHHLQQISLSQPAQERLFLAVDEAQRLANLLNEISLYAKPQVSQRVAVEINALAAATLDTLRATKEALGREIILNPASVEVIVLGDRDKLKQVLINLVRNACEAIAPGETVTCTVKLDTDTSQVCIHVHNGGAAIPPYVLAKLTQPFYSTKPSGTGLGLAIVKRIVEEHTGTLSIQSDPLAGTTVSICLPLGDQPKSRYFLQQL